MSFVAELPPLKQPDPAPKEIIDEWLANRHRVEVDISGCITVVYVEQKKDAKRAARETLKRESSRLPAAGAALIPSAEREYQLACARRGSARSGIVQRKKAA